MTQEQNFETPRTMGMNRGFLGRVIALGLFVSVGTFAVTHSLSKPKSVAKADVASKEQAENIEGSDSPINQSDSPKVVDNIPAIVAANAEAIEKADAANVPEIIKASVSSSSINQNQSGFNASPATAPQTRDERNSGEPKENEKIPGATKLRDRTEPDFSSQLQDKSVVSSANGSDTPKDPPENGFQINSATSPTKDIPGGGVEAPPSRTFDQTSNGSLANDENSAVQAKPPLLRITNPIDIASSNPAKPSPEAAAQPTASADSGFAPVPVKSVDNLTGTSPNTDGPNPSQIRSLAAQPAGESVNPEPLAGQTPTTSPSSQSNPLPSFATRGSADPAAETPASSGLAGIGGAVAPLAGPGATTGQSQPQIQYPTQVPKVNQPPDDKRSNLQASLNSQAAIPPVESQPFVTQPTTQPVAQPIAGQPRLPPVDQPQMNPNPERSEKPSAFPMIPDDSSLESRPLAASGIAGTRGTPGEAALEGLQRPSLTIEKIAPQEIQVNQIAKFKIVVRNVGQVAATEVIVSDQIPAGAELVGANPSAENRTSDGKIQWNLGRIAAGDEKSIELEIRPTRPGEIGSVAQVTFSTQASARTRVTRPELAIEHSGPAKVLIGNQVPLRFVVHNRGDGPATDVLLLERVPNQLKFNDEFRDLEYPVGTIPPGKSKEINLSLTAVEAGRFNNVVMVTGAGGLESRHQIEIEVVAPQLEGEISGPTRRFLKREASHKFTISNSGTAPASNLDIVARLPRGVQFVSANNRGQYDPGSHSVYWSLVELTPSQSANVELSTLPVETGNHEIEFRTTADLKQSVTRRQALTIEHLVDVFFDIRDTTDPIEVGGSTSYRIRIVNQGTKPASEVRLEVNMAEGVRATRVDSTAAHEIRGQVVSFAPITSINPGEEVVVEIEAVGTSPGEHRVSANLRTAEREINLTKEESTRVYADR
ncbi:MAG: DUF11 domain-containing protein [Pirellulaceae bacterium]|nr:DUF11 domain-containing protein [Pirellulaceae bacterium]